MKKTLISLLLLTACSNKNISENRDKLLEPLKNEAITFCNENNKNPSLYRYTEHNSWVSYRKNKLLELVGCESKSIKWICEEKKYEGPYNLKEIKYSDACENQEINLEKLNGIESWKYEDIIKGQGTYSYNNFKK